MPKASLIQHVYADIKVEVCSGRLVLGEKVDIAGLCDRHNASKSVVRNALNRLVGEGILEPRTHDGFYRPRLTRDKLADLYQWSLLLQSSSLHLAISAKSDPPFLETTTPSGDFVSDTEVLFSQMAAACGNGEIRHAVGNVNDRLRPIRRGKAYLLADAAELAPMQAALASRDFAHLLTLVEIYHARRMDHLPEIIALAYKDANGHAANAE